MKEWKIKPKFSYPKIKETKIEDIPLPCVLQPKPDGELTFLFYHKRMQTWVTVNNWGHCRTDYSVTDQANSDYRFDKTKVYVGELHTKKDLYDFLRNKSNGEALYLSLFDVLDAENPSYRLRKYKDRLMDIHFLGSTLTSIYYHIDKVSSKKCLTRKDIEDSFYTWCQGFSFEGIVCKALDSFEMWKVKTHKSIDAIVLGISKKGKHYPNKRVGSLLLGLYYGDKILKVGKVGSGFKLKQRENLYASLISGKIGEDKKYIYVKPKIVIEISVHQLVPTDEYDVPLTFREPQFLRLRLDKPAKDCELYHQCHEIVSEMTKVLEGRC